MKIFPCSGFSNSRDKVSMGRWYSETHDGIQRDKYGIWELNIFFFFFKLLLHYMRHSIHCIYFHLLFWETHVYPWEYLKRKHPDHHRIPFSKIFPLCRAWKASKRVSWRRHGEGGYFWVSKAVEEGWKKKPWRVFKGKWPFYPWKFLPPALVFILLAWWLKAIVLYC